MPLLSLPLPLLSLLLLSLLPPSLSQPKATLIDCGATVSTVLEGRRWLPDTSYVSSGTPKNITIASLRPLLSTVRSFPHRPGHKFCYVVPVYRGAKYTVRTTYFYGGINRGHTPPVFDQVVDGTVWSKVNTTADYARGMSSYYEGVFLAKGKTMSVCVAANEYTDSDLFISALELVILGNSVYNSTNFGKFGLALVARNSFGYSGPIIRYPDDAFDRFWEPFGENDSTATNNTNVAVSGFCNLPPLKVFETELLTRELSWPPAYLPNSTYYIALYFADDRSSASGSSRVFNVSLNGVPYYRDLNVTPEGVVVFATRWPLAGLTKFSFSPAIGSKVNPLINAGELFEVLTLGERTYTRDVIALENIKNSFGKPPVDWSGDPCSPRQYPWTGVTCSSGRRIRIVALNLTSMGLSGSLSPNISDLTALNELWLGNNNLSGSIPDLGSLKYLEILNLENNQLQGEIPQSLGNLANLRKIFLENNNLTGPIPDTLVGKPGLNLKVDPQNNFVASPPS